MSKSAWVLSIAGAASLCLASVARATTVTLPEVTLSAEAQAKLEKIACSRPYKVKAKSISGYSFPTGLLGAWVTCEPHAEHLGHQVFGQAECDNHFRTWGCKGWLNVMFATEGYPTAVRLDDIPVAEAVGIVGYLGGVPVKEFSKLWLLERAGEDRFTATTTSGYVYEVTRRKGDTATYEVTGSGFVDY